jgi:tetratricopeptide (TPR) repeat protein
LLIALSLLLCAPAAAATREDTERAGQIQTQAKDAWESGDVDEALKLASRAISLDPGPSTWLAQQIRIEALERKGNLEGAMGHLQDYLALDGLFPEHVAWGKEARARIGQALQAQQSQAMQGVNTRRGAGVGLVVGGALPLGIGIAWLGNYASKPGTAAEKADTYGGFLDAGAVMTGVGAAVDVAGIILLATAKAPRGSASRDGQGPTFAVAPSLQPIDRGVAVGFGGRW